MTLKLSVNLLNGSPKASQTQKNCVFRSLESRQCPERRTVNGEYYLGVLDRLWKRIGRGRPEYPAGKQLFLLHDNVPPHKTKKVNEFLMKKRISLINHLPHSPDLSPCDYFLFPKLKTKIKGAFYDDTPAIQAAVTEVLKNIPINDIKKCMHALVDRSKRYIESNETYFE